MRYSLFHIEREKPMTLQAQIREMLVTILIGYPHNCTAYIAKKYGFDVSELDLATEA